MTPGQASASTQICMRYSTAQIFYDRPTMQRCLLLFLFILSGCITLEAADQSKLDSDLSAYVADDMPLAEAISPLSSQNFVCKDGANREPPQANTFECTRKKGPRWEPQYCLQ